MNPSEWKLPEPGKAAMPLLTPEELGQQAARDKASETKQRRKDAARQRWALLNRFVDEGMAGLELSDVATWLVLFRNARADGVTVVARARLLGATSLAPKTVKVSLQRLIDAGWVERMRRGGPSGGAAVYRVKSPKPSGVSL